MSLFKLISGIHFPWDSSEVSGRALERGGGTDVCFPISVFEGLNPNRQYLQSYVPRRSRVPLHACVYLNREDR